MVAFEEVGADTTLKSAKAFVLLKQSCQSTEDKKKILTMTSGVLEVSTTENAMRSLSTNVLTGATEKKKVYPTNFAEPDEDIATVDNSGDYHNTFVSIEEEDTLTTEVVEQLASTGDSDALAVQTFERDLEDLFQEIPDLHSALVSYQEARGRIV